MNLIQHSKPTVIEKGKILELVKELLDTGRFAQGKYVSLFEQELSKFFGVKYAVCVSSGTSALHLALLSLNVDNNSEVIIPSFSCVAILNAVLMTGAKPVIVDVNLEDFNLSYEEVKKKISSKTKAIILPHMFGYPAKDTQKIVELGIPVIEDTAQSIGAKICGRKVGSFGKINVMSFYATKMITTFGEGGVVLTNDKNIYEFTVDIKEYDKKDEFKLRYNYKMSEIQAIMGLLQLRMLPVFIYHRKRIFYHYKNKLKNCNNIIITFPGENIHPVFYRFIIKLKEVKEDLNSYIRKYNQLGIEVARPVSIPLDKYYIGEFICENSKLLYSTTLSLPIYPRLKNKEINYIIETTKKLVGS
ncbi:MAG: DegT/DnrJ/EryC1/StrS family aminotransferase [Elusimicrobiota bacterium]|nr:DegT/DnrJ/EryC1/StrS family aminotransferase [Endomicrobiia bacterium]MDW8166471.1 DegT/DnrJ/EryC1/StrS family aminotransferase [Elusimicrobiota bacterium]